MKKYKIVLVGKSSKNNKSLKRLRHASIKQRIAMQFGKHVGQN